jgi:hypothetical protein
MCTPHGVFNSPPLAGRDKMDSISNGLAMVLPFALATPGPTHRRPLGLSGVLLAFSL